jgi:hypothetical protein
VLQLDVVAPAQPFEQVTVLAVAAQEYVLTGVGHEAAHPHRSGHAAEAAPSLHQRDGGSGVGQAQRRGDAGQPATDHAHGRAVETPPARRDPLTVEMLARVDECDR